MYQTYFCFILAHIISFYTANKKNRFGSKYTHIGRPTYMNYVHYMVIINIHVQFMYVTMNSVNVSLI